MHKNTVLSTRPCTKTQSCPLNPVQKHSPVHSTLHKNSPVHLTLHKITVLSTQPCTKTQSYPLDPAQKHSPVHSTLCRKTQSRRAPTPLSSTVHELSSTVHELSRPYFFIFSPCSIPQLNSIHSCTITDAVHRVRWFRVQLFSFFF